MFRKISRMALAATLASVGAMFFAAAPALAHTADFEKCVAEHFEPAESCLPVFPTFGPTPENPTNPPWHVRGTQTFAKLGQTVTLPEGATWTGFGELEIRSPSVRPDMLTIQGTEDGNVGVPPFTAPLTILGIKTIVGMTFNPINPVHVVAVSAAEPGLCVNGAPQEKATCVVLSSLQKVNFGITSVSISNIKIPTQCETQTPVEYHLSTTLTLLEIIAVGAHFKGTNTVPNFKCGGLYGGLLGPVLSLLISGPNNPYELVISPN